MITTKDVKVKDQKPEKLKIISTGDVEPQKFVIKGKGKPHSKQTITTSNIDKFKHTPRTKKKNEKDTPIKTKISTPKKEEKEKK